MIVTLELVFETAKRIKLFVCAVCLCCEVCGACTCMHVEQKLNNVMIPEKMFCSREMYDVANQLAKYQPECTQK